MATRVLRASSYFEPGRLPLRVLQAHHGDNTIAPHAHDFIELVFFAAGRSVHEYAGQRYRLEPGDLFIIHPGEPHAYVHGKGVKVFNCLFLPEAILPDLEYLSRMEGFFDLVMVEPFFRAEAGLRDALHLDAAQRVRAEELLRGMERELQAQSPGYEAAARAMLIQLLVLAARFRHEVDRSGAASETDPLAEKRTLIRDCIRFVEEHYAEQIRLENLAERAYLSPEYFSKVFKRLTSQTPIEFITSLRLDKAKQLLSTSSLPVTEIAQRTGFHDANYFSRQFRKAEGMSPATWRRQNAS